MVKEKGLWRERKEGQPVKGMVPFVLGAFMMAGPVSAMGEVRFFDHFHRDAIRSGSSYVEGYLGYTEYDHPDVSSIHVGARGGIPLVPRFELGLGGGFVDMDYDGGGGASGLTDLDIVGKYHLGTRGSNRITVGGSLTLPVGDEEIGEGNADLGLFGAIRRPLDGNTVLMGSAGLNFEERGGTDRKSSLHLGGGLIHRVDGRLHLLGELGMDTEGDRMLFTAGVDYLTWSGGRLRGAVSLGIDDGSPDFMLRGGYLTGF